MYQTGGFWDDKSEKREHCYRIRLLGLSENQMAVNGFNVVYSALGELGYRFRDAGHNSERVVVSLDKPISKRHIRQLSAKMSIETDSGADLSSI